MQGEKIVNIETDNEKSPFKEKYLILYFKNNTWHTRSIRAESATKAEDWFRYGPHATKGAEYYEIYCFTGITDYM